MFQVGDSRTVIIDVCSAALSRAALPTSVFHCIKSSRVVAQCLYYDSHVINLAIISPINIQGPRAARSSVDETDTCNFDQEQKEKRRNGFLG
jgi:hypothetical protein